MDSEFSGDIQKEMFHRWLCKRHSQGKRLGMGAEREREREYDWPMDVAELEGKYLLSKG